MANKRKADVARYKAIGYTASTKVCTKCKTEKPSSDFTPNRSCSTGLKPSCKECEYANNRKHGCTRIDKLAKWAKENPEQDKKNRRNRYYKQKFGISLSERNAMALAQEGKCAICGKAPLPLPIPAHGRTETLCLDHCHKTGAIRGLLCNQCNTGIGFLGDDIELLAKAIEYIKRYQK